MSIRGSQMGKNEADRENGKKRQLKDTYKEIYYHWPCKGSQVGPAQDPWRVSENQDRRQEKNTQIRRGLTNRLADSNLNKRLPKHTLINKSVFNLIPITFEEI